MLPVRRIRRELRIAVYSHRSLLAGAAVAKQYRRKTKATGVNPSKAALSLLRQIIEHLGITIVMSRGSLTKPLRSFENMRDADFSRSSFDNLIAP